MQLMTAEFEVYASLKIPSMTRTVLVEAAMKRLEDREILADAKACASRYCWVPFTKVSEEIPVQSVY